jgi:hypothetical protein
MGVLEQRVVGVLSERLTQMGLVVAVRLQQLHNGSLPVLAEVVDQTG